MNTAKISDATDWFEVLQTCEKSQTAVMTLKPGAASGPTPDAHEKSEQVLLVLEGEVEAEIAGEKRRLKQGDIVVIPAGTKHRFQNRSDAEAVTFNVYSPPEYPPATKG